MNLQEAVQIIKQLPSFNTFDADDPDCIFDIKSDFESHLRYEMSQASVSIDDVIAEVEGEIKEAGFKYSPQNAPSIGGKQLTVADWKTFLQSLSTSETELEIEVETEPETELETETETTLRGFERILCKQEKSRFAPMKRITDAKTNNDTRRYESD